MLQILANSLMIATRMDSPYGRLPDQRPRRPQAHELEAAVERRRGWFRIAGLLL